MQIKGYLLVCLLFEGDLGSPKSKLMPGRLISPQYQPHWWEDWKDEFPFNKKMAFNLFIFYFACWKCWNRYTLVHGCSIDCRMVPAKGFFSPRKKQDFNIICINYFCHVSYCFSITLIQILFEILILIPSKEVPDQLVVH